MPCARRANCMKFPRRSDPYLEIAEITDRVVKAGGPALLFTRPTNSRFPVLTNQFGTRRRMAMALDAASLDDASDRLRALLQVPAPGRSLRERVGALAALAPLRNAIPKIVSNAPRARSRRTPSRFARASGAYHLAARRRTLRYVAASHHQRSANGAPERRHVSHAGVRSRAKPACTGNATSKDGRTPRHAAENSRCGCDRHRSGADVRRHRAATADRRRVRIRWIAARTIRSSSFARKPSTCWFRRARNSFWKDTSTTTIFAPKDRSAIIPACTVWRIRIRRFT